jgi:purine-binding chemotaxis protein CheW
MAQPNPSNQALQQVLCFTLADENYGIPILKVREIQSQTVVTRIPQAPEFLSGVTNLRGAIVPIVDLRVRFSLGSPPAGSRPVTIIVEVQGRTMGMRVDMVSDVLDLAPEQLKPAPEWADGAALGREFITGLASLGEGEASSMLILLDLDSLLSMDELRNLASAGI